MSDETRTSEHRRPRRSNRRSGGRSRNSDRNTDRNSDYRPSTGERSRNPRTKSAPKKKTFWQKIVAFFTGESKETTKLQRKDLTKPHAPRKESSAEQKPKAPREKKERGTLRKPEAVEVTTPRVYVGNLSFDVSESDLQELFNGIGLVQNVEIVWNKNTNRSKGFGFVQMQTVEEAKRAVSELHDKEYMGRKLVVSGAKAVEERRERSQPPKTADAPSNEVTEESTPVAAAEETAPPTEEQPQGAAVSSEISESEESQAKQNSEQI